MKPTSIIDTLTDADRSRVIEMAWQDRTPFEAIEAAYGLTEKAVMKLIRAELKTGSFRLWRKRVTGLKTKHHALMTRGYD